MQKQRCRDERCKVQGAAGKVQVQGASARCKKVQAATARYRVDDVQMCRGDAGAEVQIGAQRCREVQSRCRYSRVVRCRGADTSEW